MLGFGGPGGGFGGPGGGFRTGRSSGKPLLLPVLKKPPPGPPKPPPGPPKPQAKPSKNFFLPLYRKSLLKWFRLVRSDFSALVDKILNF